MLDVEKQVKSFGDSVPDGVQIDWQHMDSASTANRGIYGLQSQFTGSSFKSGITKPVAGLVNRNATIKEKQKSTKTAVQ